MDIYMHPYTNVNVYISIYIYKYIYVYTDISIYIHICAYVYIYIYILKNTYTNTCIINTYIHLEVNIYTHNIHTYAGIYLHKYTYIYIPKHAPMLVSLFLSFFPRSLEKNPIFDVIYKSVGYTLLHSYDPTIKSTS
jgi:hypothetical protein